MEILINDLLDHAKMENEQFTFSSEYFDLMETVNEAFQIIEHTANERRVHLEARISNKKHFKFIRNILGDQRRYLQVLLNFISNSLKFTNQDGRVIVLIQLLSHQSISSMESDPDESESSALSMSKFIW